MNTYRKRVNYRKIYETHNGVKIGKDEFGRKHEIHHIDGNHDNNDPLNLMEVTIQEHYDIHYSQGDAGACFLMAERMNLSPEEISRLASLANAKRVDDGRHNFLGDQNPSHRRVDDGSHHFLGDNNPSHKRVDDGSHHFLGSEFNNKRVADGSHPFLGGEIARESNQRRLKDGSHHLLGPNSPNQVEWTCPHCGKSGKGLGSYTRWHGDNCKSFICEEV